MNVGDAVDSSEAAGIVAAQNPGAGRVGGGTAVTINPSNGQGIAVPDVSGKQLDKAISDLRGAGFGNVQPGTCAEDTTAGPQGKATGTNPGAGTVVNRNSAITVNYSGARSGTSVPNPYAKHRPHRSRSGGGGRCERCDLGHRHRALPVHDARASGAHPAERFLAGARSAPLRRPHGAVAAPQAALDGRAR